MFDRSIVSENDYAEFWHGYWKSENKDEFINAWLGMVTKNRAEADARAKAIGGYVVRRNKRGQFSKRGRFYHVVRRRK